MWGVFLASSFPTLCAWNPSLRAIMCQTQQPLECSQVSLWVGGWVVSGRVWQTRAEAWEVAVEGWYSTDSMNCFIKSVSFYVIHQIFVEEKLGLQLHLAHILIFLLHPFLAVFNFYVQNFYFMLLYLIFLWIQVLYLIMIFYLNFGASYHV